MKTTTLRKTQVIKEAKNFKKEIQTTVGDVESMTTTANSIRIIWKDDNQVSALLSMDAILKIRVLTTMPKILYKISNKKDKYEHENSHSSSETWKNV